MKKIISISLILWILSLIFLYFILLPQAEENQKYLVNVNRIQNWLENNQFENLDESFDLSNFNSEELGAINAVNVIDLKILDSDKISDFFRAAELNNYRYLYRYAAADQYLVRYQLDLNNDYPDNNFIYAGSLLTLIFIIFLSFYYKTEKEILTPLKNASELPEKLALGQIKSLELSSKNKYLKKLSWGLDMLQEKLEAEKEINYQLEKEHKTMVAGLSHDIRTPLSTIKNYAIALAEGVYTKPAEIEKALEIIISRTDEIEKLSRKLIKSAEKEVELGSLKSENQELYLNEIHSRLLNIISEKIERLPVKFEAERPSENLLLKADINLLDQLFNNIVDNALKYGDLKKLSLTYKTEDYYQLLELENTGPQIPAKELKHIFNSYYRGSNTEAKAGFGLGLYISKKIMSSLEGDIYAQNTDQGVKIVLVFKMA